MTLHNDCKLLNIAFIRLFKKIAEDLHLRKVILWLSGKILTMPGCKVGEYNKTYIELNFAKKVGYCFLVVGIGFGILLTTIK